MKSQLTDILSSILTFFGDKKNDKLSLDEMKSYVSTKLDKVNNKAEKHLAMKVKGKVSTAKSKISLLTIITEQMFELNGMSADI